MDALRCSVRMGEASGCDTSRLDQDNSSGSGASVRHSGKRDAVLARLQEEHSRDASECSSHSYQIIPLNQEDDSNAAFDGCSTSSSDDHQLLECKEELHGSVNAAATSAAAGDGRCRPGEAGHLSETHRIVRNDQLREQQRRVSANYLDNHSPATLPTTFITPHMRSMAIGWTIEVADELQLQQETLFLAISLFDRFLSATKDVGRDKLQLVAVACILVAAKQEETYVPTVEQLVELTAKAFMPQDVVRMELLLLDCLDWQVTSPTGHTFLMLLAQCLQGVQPSVLAMACFLLELAQLEYACLAHPPSLQAAAALLLAQMAHRTPTDAAPALASLLQLQPCQLDACGQALVRLHVAAAAAVGEPSSEPMLAVRTKYESGRMGGVGRVDPVVAYGMADLHSRE